MKTPKLLEYFPAKVRGPVLNEVFNCTRSGVRVASVVEHIISTKIRQYSSRYTLSPTLEALKQFLAQNDPEIVDALLDEAIEHCVSWDALPFDERERIKASKAQVFATNGMKGKEPTDRQKSFIKSKGYEVPADRYEASQLIDKIIKGS